MKFFTTSKLGEKRALTPEGFLAIMDVPIARTGILLYGPGEVPIPPGPDNTIKIYRDENEVFKAEHIASYAGKAFVISHPEEDVGPSNWKTLMCGTVMSPRRGTGIQSDLLMADIMVYEPEAIAKLKDDLEREVSCGYEAEYEEIGPGEGRQLNMIGNHVALVEAGRCGGRCAIGDQSTVTGKDEQMKTRDHAVVKTTTSPNKVSKWWADFNARLREAYKAKDEAGVEKLMNETPPTEDEGGSEVHIHTYGTQSGEEHGQTGNEKTERMGDEEIKGGFKKMEDAISKIGDAVEEIKKHVGMGQDAAAEKETEGRLKEEAPAGTGDKAMKAKDSKYLVDSFQDTVAAAEVLAPGIRIPAFDEAAKPGKTYDAICGLRRKALEFASNTPEGAAMIEEVNGKPVEDFSVLTCDSIRPLFMGVAALKRKANNAKGSGGETRDLTAAGVKAGPRSLADINAANAKLWG